MPHNLFGERFLAHREPAWHGLGHVFQDPISAAEAVERTGIAEIVVEKRPLLVDLGGVVTGFGESAIVRLPTSDDPQYRVLGTCSDTYGIIQHADLVLRLDGLTEKWPVETIGVLGQGETMFVALDAGGADVKGDPIRKYFLLTDTKDGGTGIRLHFTPVRVVCQNTLMMGEEQAIASAKLRHTQNVSEELDWRLNIVKRLQDVSDRAMGQFDLIAGMVMTTGQIETVIAKAYPYPRKPSKVTMADSMTIEDLAKLGGLVERLNQAQRGYETAIARADERRMAVREMFGKFNDDQSGLARTGWAIYNAVVECEDYREKAGNEDPYVAALFGERAATKRRAFSAVLRESNTI